MGMIQRINLCAVSNSPTLSAGLTSLLKKNNEIYLHDCFRSFDTALNYFHNNSTSPKNNNVAFIDDLSLNKAETVDFLKCLKGDFKFREIKTIVYTDSVKPEYFNELISSNVMSILHDYETPLSNSLLFLEEEDDRGIIQTNLNFTNTGLTWKKVNEKLIKIITLTKSACICYDRLIINSMTSRGFSWGKGKTDNDKPSQLLIPGSSELSKVAEKIKLLSKREKEIILKMAEGKKNIQIADELHISADTVSQHKAHMLTKLGLKSVQSLSMLAFLLINGQLS